MNHFYYSMIGITSKVPSTPESLISKGSYENLKDQERLFLQDKELETPSVVWKSHRKRVISKGKNQEAQRAP